MGHNYEIHVSWRMDKIVKAFKQNLNRDILSLDDQSFNIHFLQKLMFYFMNVVKKNIEKDLKA